MKSKVKITEKLAESLNLDLKKEELNNYCIKRINYDSPNDEISDNGESYGIITSNKVDSDGDVFLMKGIDFSRFEKNPVVLFNHDHNNPIAYAEELQVQNDKILAKVKFSSIKEAQKVRQLVKDKVIRSHSVGIIPLDGYAKGESGFEEAKLQLTKEFPGKFDNEDLMKINRIITNSQLVEFSFVTIPANTDAEITEIKSIVKDDEDVKENAIEDESTMETVETKEEVEKNETVEVEEVEEVEKKRIEVRMIKRANPIRVISTKKSRELEMKKELYRRMWGV